MSVRRGAALGLCAALGLVACSSSGPAVTSLPTLGPSGTPAATAVPAVTGPPVIVPAGTAAATSDGAVAFARFFYAQVESAYTRHDARLIRSYSLSTCTACTRWAADVEAARRAGQRVTGVVFDITSVIAPVLLGNSITVRVAYSEPAGHRYDRSGGQVGGTAARPAAVELLGLARAQGAWKVASASLH